MSTFASVAPPAAAEQNIMARTTVCAREASRVLAFRNFEVRVFCHPEEKGVSRSKFVLRCVWHGCHPNRYALARHVRGERHLPDGGIMVLWPDALNDYSDYMRMPCYTAWNLVTVPLWGAVTGSGKAGMYWHVWCLEESEACVITKWRKPRK